MNPAAPVDRPFDVLRAAEERLDLVAQTDERGDLRLVQRAAIRVGGIDVDDGRPRAVCGVEADA